MKYLILITVATLCFAATESRISTASILAVEKSINQRFAVRTGDPYDVLGQARGTYLEGYGALFTVEVDLINTGSLFISPFKPTATKEEIAATHERKLKKIDPLKETMRDLLLNASGTLEGLPPNERVAMEAILFNFSWEDSRGLPRRVFMSAEKRKLLAAKAAHAGPAEIDALFEEQER
jgi:hypothetical protein